MLQVLQLLHLLLVMLLVELVITVLLVRFMPCLFFFGAWRCTLPFLCCCVINILDLHLLVVATGLGTEPELAARF